MQPSRTKVAILGARGIANYGGFETLVSEIAPRLVEKGYDVFVSHRVQEDGRAAEEYRGVRILYFPIRFPRSSRIGRVFEVLYDWYFLLKSCFWVRCDYVYCLGIASALLMPLCRLSRSTIVVNVDGVEWERAKFSGYERAYIRLSFLVSCIFSDVIVLDNGQLAHHVPRGLVTKAVVIPYGVSPVVCQSWDPSAIGKRAGANAPRIDRGSYWLVVARLEPENNIHLIVEAYARSRSSRPVVVVGGFSSKEYEKRVRSLISRLPSDKSVSLIGPVYDQEQLSGIRCGCRAYIHGHSVGGTNPSLLEAMAAGNAVLAHGNVFNREVSGDTALYFDDAQTLAGQLDRLDGDSARIAELGRSALARVRERYTWDQAVDLFQSILARSEFKRGPSKPHR